MRLHFFGGSDGHIPKTVETKAGAISRKYRGNKTQVTMENFRVT
jgi:hypothetical protein